MNYGFYISGKSARLYKFLCLTSKQNIDSTKIVVSDGEIPISLCNLLDSLSIKYIDINWNSLGVNNHERNRKFSNILKGYLSEYKIDYLFSFGEHLLVGKILEEYQWHLINFHPAILPMYPGKDAVDQAVKHGNTFLIGNTAHFIDKGVDTGPIIMQSVIPLKAFYNSGNNYDSVLDLIISMLEKLIELLENRRIIIKDGAVDITGADYNQSLLFPKL